MVGAWQFPKRNARQEIWGVERKEPKGFAGHGLDENGAGKAYRQPESWVSRRLRIKSSDPEQGSFIGRLATSILESLQMVAYRPSLNDRIWSIKKISMFSHNKMFTAR